MNLPRFLDIQSWWEVPSVAYFCSLFRTAFNLLDFDIEELEEALLADGNDETASSLLTEIIVRLLNGCFENNDISAFNYQMYLRRLFRRKCQEAGRCNPFNSDIDFQFLPLRKKVEILYALCDFRLDAGDVYNLFKNLEAESLRVEPLGWDNNDSAYWYFYGTRLYREDILVKSRSKTKKRRGKKKNWFYGDDWLDNEEIDRVWQVICFTETDWNELTAKFSKSTSKVERELYRSLSLNFLPEIPRLFLDKERLQRKRLLELAPRRTSNRVLQKIKQQEEDVKQSEDQSTDTSREEGGPSERLKIAREIRARRRILVRKRTASSSSSEEDKEEEEEPIVKEMPQKVVSRKRKRETSSKNSSSTDNGEPPPEPREPPPEPREPPPEPCEPPPEPPAKPGRKTNNSLSSATGQILISDTEEPVNGTRRKMKTSQIFRQTEEDIQTDMYKVLEQLTAHDDAWPFLDPVEEEYAPNYYAVIRRPMDLNKMEERLDNGYYADFEMFKSDFKLIVNNCRLYNGQDNEYTTMVDNLQVAFDRLTEKYINRISSSDEEIAVEYQIPTPRKHKRKRSESPPAQLERKKSKSHSEDTAEAKSGTSSDAGQEVQQSEKGRKRSREGKEGKVKKKRHRHGKHSKSRKTEGEHETKKERRNKRKHSKEGKKSKEKKKKSKHSHKEESKKTLKRSCSRESVESSNRSRSASPLPSIHTPSPSPSPTPTEPETSQETDFIKDKYDKIKGRKRHASKEAWDSLFDYQQSKAIDKQKHTDNNDKNQILKETIERLKAKNMKSNSTLYNTLYPSTSRTNVENRKRPYPRLTATRDPEFDDDDEDNEDSSDEDFDLDNPMQASRNIHKKYKNESASVALEQAAKDISKLLDEAPKSSNMSSPCDSPAITISTEDQDNSRQDDELSQGERSSTCNRVSRKRPRSRETTSIKRREVQRTIDRLQPGKSKGNLLTNVSTSQKVEEDAPQSTIIKVRESDRSEECSPKLSLGSVLATVEFTLGNDHNFNNNEDSKDNEKLNTLCETDTSAMAPVDKTAENPIEVTVVLDSIEETKSNLEETTPTLSKEKHRPDLSAWFKAFGTSKHNINPSVKRKVESDPKQKVLKRPKPTTVKYDSPSDEIPPIADGGDSPLPSVTPRQRRTSTGSSISERSSFSQDLDSPRHQMSHTSPLLNSPASPRTDDFQKLAYPIINGTVRAGFYQDTASIKSSPEKSCSPRDAPQSPFSPCSQHVYASNSAMESTTLNYFVDNNKSPLPTYGLNQPPPYYDTAKASTVNKAGRGHEDYTSLGPDSFQSAHFTEHFASETSPYSQDQGQQSSYDTNPPASLSKMSPTESSTSAQVIIEPKNNTFPVKKRAYTETDTVITNHKRERKDELISPLKGDYQKIVQNMSSLPSTSVDEIAMALTEKSEMAKLNAIRERSAADFLERQRQNLDLRSNIHYETSDLSLHDKKKEMSTLANMLSSKKDNIDMINMGYNNHDIERRGGGEVEMDYMQPIQLTKAALSIQPNKGYEVDSIAMNLGMNSQQLHKNLSKANIATNILATEKPAHVQTYHDIERRGGGEVEMDYMQPRQLTKAALSIQHNKGYEVDSIATNLGMNSQQQLHKNLSKANMPTNILPTEKPAHVQAYHDIERRGGGEVEMDYMQPRQLTKAALSIQHNKGYEVDSIATNLGMNSQQQLHKNLSKANMPTNILPTEKPAHVQTYHDIERRGGGEVEMDYMQPRQLTKAALSIQHNKGYEVDSIATNLGMNSQQQLHKNLSKANMPTNILPTEKPAHVQTYHDIERRGGEEVEMDYMQPRQLTKAALSIQHNKGYEVDSIATNLGMNSQQQLHKNLSKANMSTNILPTEKPAHIQTYHDIERRGGGEVEMDYMQPRQLTKAALSIQHNKGYEVDSIATNLGMNSQQQLHKNLSKANMPTNILPTEKPAHVQTYRDIERRGGGEVEMDYMQPRQLTKAALSIQHNKGYEVDSIAMNLGMNSQQQLHKNLSKANMPTNILPTEKPAHVQTYHDIERRGGGEVEMDYMQPRQLTKAALSIQHNKGYEVDSIATNLGMNSQQQLHKNLSKANMSTEKPAHVQTYDHLPPSGQNVSNFSLNDIELANKKLYACNQVANNATVDYGNWKLTNQSLKQDMLPSDYSTTYNTSSKLKAGMSVSTASAINYNKNLQQYHNYTTSRSNLQRSHDTQQNVPSELRIPNPRGMMKSDTSTLHSECDLVGKNMESSLKAQKTEKLIQSHPLVSSLQYKAGFGNHSSLQLESLRNLQNIPQMFERYTNDERYLSTFAGTSSLYHDKFQMAQMFNKSTSDAHPPSTSVYSQPSTSVAKDTNIYKSPVNLQTTTAEVKTKSKRKRAAESKHSQSMANQSYHPASCNNDVLSSVKTSMVPGSAFNFGASANMALGGGLYGDSSGFSIEDFRNNTANQLMAANYMAAAVAHQRNSSEAITEKVAKPAHQNSSHSTATSFPFMAHSQVRATYPFVGADSSSPLYQQYLQRHQEELLRQTGAQIMGLYPPGYPASLGVRQQYDAMNRPSWI